VAPFPVYGVVAMTVPSRHFPWQTESLNIVLFSTTIGLFNGRLGVFGNDNLVLQITR